MTGFGDTPVMVPDLVEPITAYRAFGVNDDGELRGYGGTTWPVGAPLEAECHGIASSGHYGSLSASIYSPRNVTPCIQCPSPDKGSHNGYGCGIYAYRTPMDLAACGSTTGIWAEIQMWGTVYEHTRGWRSQYAQPVAVWRAPCTPDARRAADRYGLPLIDPPLTQDDVNQARADERDREAAARAAWLRQTAPSVADLDARVAALTARSRAAMLSPTPASRRRRFGIGQAS